MIPAVDVNISFVIRLNLTDLDLRSVGIQVFKVNQLEQREVPGRLRYIDMRRYKLNPSHGPHVMFYVPLKGGKSRV